MWQQTHHSILPAGSVAIVNPGRSFKKAWLPGTRQLWCGSTSDLMEREFHAWTGADDARGIAFDVPPIGDRFFDIGRASSCVKSFVRLAGLTVAVAPGGHPRANARTRRSI
jgi:hypothetical protein